MMTLDEAIKHAEEVARKQEKSACNMEKRYGAHVAGYEMHSTCAEEHRQLAKWLSELQDFKKREEPRPPIRTYVLVEGQDGERIDVWACPKCTAILETERDGERKLGTFLRERCRWCGQIFDWRNGKGGDEKE